MAHVENKANLNETYSNDTLFPTLDKIVEVWYYTDEQFAEWVLTQIEDFTKDLEEYYSSSGFDYDKWINVYGEFLFPEQVDVWYTEFEHHNATDAFVDAWWDRLDVVKDTVKSKFDDMVYRGDILAK